MIKNQEIICFAGNDWWYRHPGSTTHIMKYLARYNKVIYVNSILMDVPNIRASNLLSRIRGKLRSYFKWMKKLNKQLLIFSPVTIPFYSIPVIRKISRLLLLLQLRHCMKLFHIAKPILWIDIPTAYEIVNNLTTKLLIYNVIDRYTAKESRAKGIIKYYHSKLMASGNLILFSSYKYYEESAENQANAYFLDHAVEYKHFSKTINQDLIIPDDIASIKRPIVGYIGTAHEDWELVRYLVRRKPNWNFVFIGRKQNVKIESEKIPNLFFLGQKPYSILPNYAKVFDVCILPYKIDEWVEYSNPIKLKEYLSTGKPVVSISFPAVERYKDIVYCARNKEEFLKYLEFAIYEDTAELQKKRIDAVRYETWDKRVEEISERISSFIN